MATGFQSIELAVHHVRNDCQRMPVSRLQIYECLRQSPPGDSRTDKRIAVNVGAIVVIHEIEPECLSEHKPNEGKETEANQNSGDFASRRTIRATLHGMLGEPDKVPVRGAK